MLLKILSRSREDFVYLMINNEKIPKVPNATLIGKLFIIKAIKKQQ